MLLIVPIKRTLVPTFPLDGVKEVIATFTAFADGRDIERVDATISIIMRAVKMVDLFNLYYSICLVNFQHVLNTFTINGTF